MRACGKVSANLPPAVLANQFVELVAYRFPACLNGLLIKGELGIRGPSLMLGEKDVGIGAQRADFDCLLGKRSAFLV